MGHPVVALVFFALFVMPVIILSDSKKRFGRYSWGWATIAFFTIAAMLPKRGIPPVFDRVQLGMALGKIAGLCIGLFYLYRYTTKSRVGVAAQSGELSPVRIEGATKPPDSEASHDHVRRHRAQDEGVKTCPQCAETIKLRAVVCRYCAYHFDESELSAEIARSIAEQKRADEIRESRAANQRLRAETKRSFRIFGIIGVVTAPMGGLVLLFCLFILVTPPPKSAKMATKVTLVIFTLVTGGALLGFGAMALRRSYKDLVRLSASASEDSDGWRSFVENYAAADLADQQRVWSQLSEQQRRHLADVYRLHSPFSHGS